MKSLRTGLFVLALSYGLLGSSAHAAPSGREIDNEAAERAVRAAYAAFGERLSASGIESSIEVANFVTFSRSQVESMRWSDLVSLPPANLRLDRSQRSDYIEGLRTVTFKASWQDPRPMTSRQSSLASGPAMAVIDEAADTYHQLARFVAVTTFSVDLGVLGRSESYRAAFLWLPERATGTYVAYVADPVTDGVEKALKEKVSLEGDRLGGGRGDSWLTPTTGQQCIVWSSTQTFKKDPPKGTDNHISGAHKASVTLSETCSCDVQCRSTCVADVVGPNCFDNGLTTTPTHVMAQDSDASSASVATGVSGGATCAAGFACSYKSCAFGLCGFSVDVTIVNKVAVKFTIVGQDGWSVTRGDTYSCAKCEVLPDPPSDAPAVPAGADSGGIYVPENQIVDNYSGSGGGPLPFAPGGCQWTCTPVWSAAGMHLYDYCWLRC